MIESSSLGEQDIQLSTFCIFIFGNDGAPTTETRSLTTVLTHATIVAAFIRAPQTPAAQLRRYVDSDDDNSHDADAATPTTTLTPLLLTPCLEVLETWERESSTDDVPYREGLEEARAWVESELSDQSFAELSEDEQREIDAWAFSVVPPRICGELPPQGETGSGTRQEPKGGDVEQEQRAAAEEDEMPGANAEEGMPSRQDQAPELSLSIEVSSF